MASRSSARMPSPSGMRAWCSYDLARTLDRRDDSHRAVVRGLSREPVAVRRRGRRRRGRRRDRPRRRQGLLAALDGSGLAGARRRAPRQDPLSFRCVAPGAWRGARRARARRQHVEIELNARRRQPARRSSTRARCCRPATSTFPASRSRMKRWALRRADGDRSSSSAACSCLSPSASGFRCSSRATVRSSPASPPRKNR